MSRITDSVKTRINRAMPLFRDIAFGNIIQDLQNGPVQTLTVSGAITPGIQSIELNHASVAVETTIASLLNHPGLLVIKDNSASGTTAHKVTVTTGTLNGTNKVATLNAPGEQLVLYIDSAGNGAVVLNAGAVVFSG